MRTARPTDRLPKPLLDVRPCQDSQSILDDPPSVGTEKESARAHEPSHIPPGQRAPVCKSKGTPGQARVITIVYGAMPCGIELGTVWLALVPLTALIFICVYRQATHANEPPLRCCSTIQLNHCKQAPC